MIITYWSWRGIFLVNLPIGVALIVLGAIFFPTGQRQHNARLDAVGAGMLGVLLLSAMLAITELGGGAGPFSPRFLAPLLVGLTMLALFARHIRRAEAPFVAPRLLVGDGFGTVNLVNIVIGSLAIGTSALLPLYAQDRYGIRPLESGTLLTLRAVGMVVVTMVAVMLLRRFGYRRPIMTGLVIISVSLVLLFVEPIRLSPYAWLGVSAGITGLGLGMVMPAANNATLHMAPTHVAAISGLRGMFRQTGGIASISIVTAVAAQVGDPGRAIAISFLALAAASLLILPLVLRIPEEPQPEALTVSDPAEAAA